MPPRGRLENPRVGQPMLATIMGAPTLSYAIYCCVPGQQDAMHTLRRPHPLRLDNTDSASSRPPDGTRMG